MQKHNMCKSCFSTAASGQLLAHQAVKLCFVDVHIQAAVLEAPFDRGVLFIRDLYEDVAGQSMSKHRFEAISNK